MNQSRMNMADGFLTRNRLQNSTDQPKLITISKTKNQVAGEESIEVQTVNDSAGDSRVLLLLPDVASVLEVNTAT